MLYDDFLPVCQIHSLKTFIIYIVYRNKLCMFSYIIFSYNKLYIYIYSHILCLTSVSPSSFLTNNSLPPILIYSSSFLFRKGKDSHEYQPVMAYFAANWYLYYFDRKYYWFLIIKKDLDFWLLKYSELECFQTGIDCSSIYIAMEKSMEDSDVSSKK